MLSFDLTVDNLRDFARMTGIEFVLLDENTTPYALEKELMLGDIIWR